MKVTTLGVASVIISLIILTVALKLFLYNKKTMPMNIQIPNNITKLVITSPYFENNKIIPLDFTCDGKNIFPTLEIDNIPTSAKSLLIYIADPDAPGGTFIHLMAGNIQVKGKKETITEKTLQNAILGTNFFQNLGYDGPCPPKGQIHNYYFNVLAFSKNLNLKPGFTFEDMKNIINKNTENIEGSGYLVGLYER